MAATPHTTQISAESPLESDASKPSDPATYVAAIAGALARWGSRIAFDDLQGRAYTYDETAALVSRIQAVFRDYGLAGDQGVGILSTNRAEAWMASVAAQMEGNYYASLPWRSSIEDMTYIAKDAKLSAIVTFPEFVEKARQVAQKCTPAATLFTLGPADYGIDLLAAADLVPQAALAPARHVTIHHIAAIWYTGGTTGFPKGAVHTQASFIDAVIRYSFAYELPTEMRYLAAGPISHSGWPFIAPTLISGGTVVVMDAFEPNRFLETVETKSITFSVGVPTMIYSLLAAARSGRRRTDSLRRFIYGGSPILPSRLAEAHDTFGQIFTQLYGQSEVLGAGTVLLSSEHDLSHPERLVSCGRPIPGVQIEILDEAGKPVSSGEVGEICMRTRSAMREYWNQPNLTAECFSGGWIHTGDLGKVDEMGYYTIVDRKKDMIISGGFNVFPAEVERVIAECPEVSLVAVIGVPDPHWGEAVKAVIVPKEGVVIDVDRLLADIRARKGPVNTPKSVDIVSSLPMTSVGKIDKKLLRAPFWSGAQRHV